MLKGCCLWTSSYLYDLIEIYLYKGWINVYLLSFSWKIMINSDTNLLLLFLIFISFMLNASVILLTVIKRDLFSLFLACIYKYSLFLLNFLWRGCSNWLNIFYLSFILHHLRLKTSIHALSWILILNLFKFTFIYVNVDKFLLFY